MKNGQAPTFITEQKRTKTVFEKKYLDAFGNRQERRLDLPGLSPALIAKRQELEQIQHKLADERNGCERWTKEYELKKNDINIKKRTYDEEAKVHAQFNKQAQSDINRTKDNTDKEFQITQKLEKELEELKEKEQKLSDDLAVLKNQIKNYQPCADFLEDVVVSTKNFETPEAVLNRYKALTLSKVEYSSKLHTELGVDNKFMQKKALLATLRNQQIERNHKLSVLREELGKSAKDKRYKQINVIKVAERTGEKEAELATISTSILNICRQVIQNPIQPIKTHMAKQEVPPTMEGQLDIIKNRFLDLVEIVGDPEAARMVKIDDDLREFLKANRKLSENPSRMTSPKKSRTPSRMSEMKSDIDSQIDA